MCVIFWHLHTLRAIMDVILRAKRIMLHWCYVLTNVGQKALNTHTHIHIQSIHVYSSATTNTSKHWNWFQTFGFHYKKCREERARVCMFVFVSLIFSPYFIRKNLQAKVLAKPSSQYHAQKIWTYTLLSLVHKGMVASISACSTRAVCIEYHANSAVKTLYCEKWKKKSDTRSKILTSFTERTKRCSRYTAAVVSLLFLCQFLLCRLQRIFSSRALLFLPRNLFQIMIIVRPAHIQFHACFGTRVCIYSLLNLRYFWSSPFLCWTIYAAISFFVSSSPFFLLER